MKVGIRIKINVSKIIKDWLFAGKKGKYLDATTFVDLDQLDQYGNSGMITQDVPKDAQDDKGPILGNSIVFWKEGQQQGQQAQAPQTQQQPQQQQQQSGGFDNSFDDEAPF